MNLFTNVKQFAIMAALLPLIAVSCKDQGADGNDDPDADAPAVVSTSPADNDTELIRNKIIEITFNDEMNAATINTSTFTVSQGSANISGSVQPRILRESFFR